MTEPDSLHPHQPAIDEHMKRVGGSFEELNARIARLAIALGVSLETDDAVQRVLGMAGVRANAAPPEGVGERRRQRVAFSGQDRRQTHKWVELRGLLILRYGVEKQYVEAYGLEATRHLLFAAEEHLTRDGFKPGADGLDLRPLD
ncbi:hypothetical protein [Hydrogenophaga soli]|nr:hypothetical protein [Burkholderiaceae bacterium]